MAKHTLSFSEGMTLPGRLRKVRLLLLPTLKLEMAEAIVLWGEHAACCLWCQVLGSRGHLPGEPSFERSRTTGLGAREWAR